MSLTITTTNDLWVVTPTNQTFVVDDINTLSVEGTSVGQEALTVVVSNDTITYASNSPDGSTTGDILRWNATNDAWEVAVEPLAFKGIVLTPSSAALSDVEGGMYYRSTDKSVLVCTSDT